MKKTWPKPELIVLLRSKPEEAVLLHCKTEKIGIAAGTDIAGQACGNQMIGSRCNPCQARASVGS